MASIHILHPPNGAGVRLEGDVDESLLVKTEQRIDTEDELTTTVEYCFLDCDGDAHQTGVADSPHCFCRHHVHRSGHITLKKWPGMEGTAQPLI